MEGDFVDFSHLFDAVLGKRYLVHLNLFLASKIKNDADFMRNMHDCVVLAHKPDKFS